MATKSTEVATAEAKGSTEIGSVEGMEEFAGVGMENVTSSDILVPRITILQALSPQLKKSKTEFIEGASEGDICEVGTGEIMSALPFLPVLYRKQWLEWAPRASGGGLVNIYDDPSILEKCTPDDKGRNFTSEGNLIAETAQWFGINLASMQKCFLPMSSTQLRKSRKMMTMAMGEKLKRADGSLYTPPLFYRSYILTVGDESNSEGDWKGWVIGRGPAIHELDLGFSWQDLMADAVAFRKSLMEGERKADLNSYDGDGVVNGDGAEEKM